MFQRLAVGRSVRRNLETLTPLHHHGKLFLLL